MAYVNVTTDDGEQIERFNVEDAWGDVTKTFPRRLMVADLAAAIHVAINKDNRKSEDNNE